MKTRLKLNLVVFLLTLVMPASCQTIGGVKKLADGPSVTVTGVVSYVMPGECYVESEDRAAGIWVEGDTSGVSIGDEVNSSGVLSTVNGERVVTTSSVVKTGEQSLITALGMPLSRIGGASFGYQGSVSDRKLVKNGDISEWQWVSPVGLNNTGLLVRTWGKVTTTNYSHANGLHWFHLDDGSGLTSDLGDEGVIVYSDADVKCGQLVAVTGVSSVEGAIDEPTRLIRSVRPRSGDDVQVLKDAVPEYPFSDEFNGSSIDNHWGTVAASGYDSKGSTLAIGTISVESGEYKIDIPVGVSSYDIPDYPFSKQIVQSVEGDWDMEVKLRVVPTLGIRIYQAIGVALKEKPKDMASMIIDNPGGEQFNWLAAVTPQTSQNPDEITGRMRYVVADTHVGYPRTELNTFSKSAWFKVRKRGNMIYGSASTDGVNYTQEYSKVCYNRCYLAICGYSYGSYSTPGPFAGYCDYIRFTRVGE